MSGSPQPPPGAVDPVAEEETRVLVAAAATGDAPAQETICERYLPMIGTFFRFKAGSSHDVEDLTQRCFTVALRKLETFAWQGKRQFEAWLRGIALNIYRGWRRESFPTPFTEFLDLRVKEDQTDELQETLLRALGPMLTNIDPRFAEVLKLYYLDSKSSDECAEALGISIDNFYKRIERAKKAAREFLSVELSKYV
jgi:RNA polymerase sigma factor (sigma-70 family)